MATFNQSLVSAFGYYPPLQASEDFAEKAPRDICETFKDFDETPFPADFFPKGYEELSCEDML